MFCLFFYSVICFVCCETKPTRRRTQKKRLTQQYEQSMTSIVDGEWERIDAEDEFAFRRPVLQIKRLPSTSLPSAPQKPEQLPPPPAPQSSSDIEDGSTSLTANTQSEQVRMLGFNLSKDVLSLFTMPNTAHPTTGGGSAGGGSAASSSSSHPSVPQQQQQQPTLVATFRVRETSNEHALSAVH